jgi:hypothetical protein
MSTGDSSLLSGHRLADKLLDHLADTVLLVGMRTASESSQDSLSLPLVSQNGTLQSQTAGLRAAVALLALQVVVTLVELHHQAGSIATAAVGHSQKARGDLSPVILRPNLTLHMTRAMMAMQTRMMMSSSVSHATTVMVTTTRVMRMSSSSMSDAAMVMMTTRMSSSVSHTMMTTTRVTRMSSSVSHMMMTTMMTAASSQNVNSAQHAGHMSTMVDMGHASVNSSAVMRASMMMYMANMMMDHSSAMVVSAHVMVHMVAHVVVHSSHMMMSSHVVVSSHSSSSSSSSSEQTSLDINSQGEDQDQQQEVLHYESNKVRTFFFFFFVFFFLFFFPFFPYPFFQLLASTPYTSTTAKASR